MVYTYRPPRTARTAVITKIKSWDQKVKTEPIRGVFTGDSMLLHGASKLEGGFIARTQNKQYGRIAVPGCTVMPAFMHLSADYAVSIPFAGGNAAKGLEPFEPLKKGVPSKQYNGVGLGLQANTQSATQERYTVKHATSMGFWYRPQTTGGSITVHLDGTQKLARSTAKGVWDEARIATPDKANNEAPEGRIKFATGSHDFDGISVYRGTENRGWQFYDNSHSGFGSERFVNSSNGNTNWADQLPALGTVHFHANFLGTNDSAMDLELRKQYALDWAKLVRAKNPGCVIIMVRIQQPSFFTKAGWDEVLEAYEWVANQMTDTIVFDISKYIPVQPSNGDLMSDGTHMSELGHENMAVHFNNYFTGAYDAAGGPGEGDPGGDDTTAPVITNRFPAAGVTVAANATQDFTFEATDDSALASMVIVGSDGRIIGDKAPELISGNKYGVLGVPWSKLTNDPKVSTSNPIDTWRVAVRDSAGNLANSDSRAITVPRATAITVVPPTLTRVLPTAGKAWVPNEPIDWIISHPDGIAEAKAYTGGENPVVFAELVQQAGDHWTGTADLSKLVAGSTQYQVRATSSGGEMGQVAGISAWTPYTVAEASTPTPIVTTITSPEANAVITDVLTVRVTYSGPALKSMELCYNGGSEPIGILTNLSGSTWGTEIAGSALPSGIASIRLKFTPVVGEVSYSGPRGIKAQIATGNKVVVFADETTGQLGPETEAWIRGLGTPGGTGGAGDLNSQALDAMFAALDMGVDREIRVAGAGDSIMFPQDGWFVQGLCKLRDQKYPERPVLLDTWDMNANGMATTVTLRGSGGGGGGGSLTTQVVFSDDLNRGGQGTRTELVGSSPQVGQAWQGPTGVYSTYNNVVAEPFPGVTMDLGVFPYALMAAVPGSTDHNVTRSERFSTATSGGTTTFATGAVKANGDCTRIRITGAAAGTANAYLEVVTGGTPRIVATFPAGTVLDNQTDQFKKIVIDLTGNTLKGTLANAGTTGVTVQGTLSAAELTALTGWDRITIQSNDSRIREDLIVVTAQVGVNAGGTTTLPAIRIINGGAPGQTLEYHRTRIAAMYNLRPDVLAVSIGMNNADQSPADFRTEVKSFLAAFWARHAGVPIVGVPQNPRYVATDGAPASRIPDHAARQVSFRALCREMGWKLIDLFSLYVRQTDRGASWVEAADGKHPNTLGKVAMTDRAAAEWAELSERA